MSRDLYIKTDYTLTGVTHIIAYADPHHTCLDIKKLIHYWFGIKPEEQHFPLIEYNGQNFANIPNDRLPDDLKLSSLFSYHGECPEISVTYHPRASPWNTNMRYCPPALAIVEESWFSR